MSQIYRAVYKIFTRLAFYFGLVSWSLSKKKKNVKQNLQVICGDNSIKNQIKTYSYYNKYWTEFFLLSVKFPLNSVIKNSKYVNYTDFSFEKKTGAIFVLPHIGGWEMAGKYLSSKGKNVAAIAESLSNKNFQNWCSETREKIGVKVFFNDDPKLFSKCVNHLNDGGILCIVGDRALDSKHVTYHQVENTNMCASIATGAAMIAIKAKSDIYTVATPYDEDNHEFIIKQKICLENVSDENPTIKDKVNAINMKIFDDFMGFFNEWPTQWHCLEKYFKIIKDPNKKSIK